MIPIKINFTKKQFRALLDLVYAGNWVINATKGTDELSKDHDELQSYIFSFCKDFGFSGFSEYDAEEKKYYETKEFEESGIEEFIREYDNDNFWDELGYRLAKRDVSKDFEGRIDDSNFEEGMKRILELEEKYAEEFVRNGLNNVKIESNTIK